MPVQAKLLQFLQSKEYRPVGEARKVHHADVRIVAATNVDLKAAITRKEFREDLFYRLQVMTIRLPPLAERSEDLADLADHLAARACAQNRLSPLGVSTGAHRAIAAAEWRGNVRELANAMEAAVIRAAWEGASQIERRHVFPDVGDAASVAAATDVTLQEATRRFQREHLRDALEMAGWNVAESARRLDVSRGQLYKLIQELAIERPKA